MDYIGSSTLSYRVSSRAQVKLVDGQDLIGGHNANLMNLTAIIRPFASVKDDDRNV